MISFFNRYYIIYFVSKEHGFLDIYMGLTFCTQRRSPLFHISKTARNFRMKLGQCKQSTVTLTDHLPN